MHCATTFPLSPIARHLHSFACWVDNRKEVDSFCILPDSRNQVIEPPPPKLALVDSLGFICKFPWIASFQQIGWSLRPRFSRVAASSFELARSIARAIARYATRYALQKLGKERDCSQSKDSRTNWRMHMY